MMSTAKALTATLASALIATMLALVATMAVAAPSMWNTDSVGVVDRTTGLWYLRSPNGDTTSFYYGNPGDYPIIGDWNCDGVDTPGLYRQSDGYVYLRNSNTQGPADVKFFFGNPGDVPLAGDFNADGCDTVSIYRPSEQRFYVINVLGSSDGGLGAADYAFDFGNPGDKPFVADVDLDGVDEVGLHRESTGFVYYRNTLTTGVADNQFFYGDPGDQIIAGRWAQNPSPGPDTVGIFRPSLGTFYLRFTNTQGNADVSFVYGNANMAAVAGSFGSLPGGGAPPPGSSTTTTTVPPPPSGFTFGAGTWIVGSQIPADTYVNVGFSSGCYWERLSGFGGELSDVIANNFDDVRQIVEIKPTDAGFSTDADCGTWTMISLRSRRPRHRSREGRGRSGLRSVSDAGGTRASRRGATGNAGRVSAGSPRTMSTQTASTCPPDRRVKAAMSGSTPTTTVAPGQWTLAE